jgi:hypothetical protein
LFQLCVEGAVRGRTYIWFCQLIKCVGMNTPRRAAFGEVRRKIQKQKRPRRGGLGEDCDPALKILQESGHHNFVSLLFKCINMRVLDLEG